MLLACGLYLGGYHHGKHRLIHECEQAALDAFFWSEMTNLDDAKSALNLTDREASPEMYDAFSRSFYRSAANVLELRQRMDPDFWNLEYVDVMIDGIKRFIAANPSSQSFISELPDGDNVAPVYRKKTFIDLLHDLDFRP